MKYLLTQSLLSSWQYSMRQGDLNEFVAALCRKPSEENDAKRKGIEWESLVTFAMDHDENPGMADRVWKCARTGAGEIEGASLQVSISKTVKIDDMEFVLNGKLDALLAGEIIDIKYREGYAKWPYKNNQYLESPQAPMYFALCPEATTFRYRIFDGNDLYKEEYARDDVEPIESIIRGFIRWLKAVGMMKTYLENWRAE
jgi:hypothetical protein